MNKLLTILKWMLNFPQYLIISIMIAVIVGLITWNVVFGFFTLLGIMVILIVFVFLRQLWWWITSTGDYEKNDIKK